MPLKNSKKTKATIKPVNIRELNEKAALTPEKPQPKNPKITSEEDSNETIEEIKEYKKVKELLKAGVPFIFVTGGAGTGKSTLISYLKKTLIMRMAVCAPTGVAALNVGGVTLHSLFLLPPHIIQLHDIHLPKNRSLYTKLDLLIIDEVSMVRPDILDGINLFLQKARKNNKPFGGVNVLCIGDLYQLPPVVNNHDFPILKQMGYETEFFFSAHCLRDTELVPVVLTRIFRQRDENFTRLLNNIRVGKNVGASLVDVNAATQRKRTQKENLLVLVCTNNKADMINGRQLAKLDTESGFFKGEITGEFNIGKDKLPSPMDLNLKVNAKVMFTKNDEQRRWVNGSLGKVVKIKKSSVKVELVDEIGQPVYEVKAVSWEKFKYEYDKENDKIIPKALGTYKQLPLMLAWAVTIHKSQGKTLSNIYIDLGYKAFANGQVYVALSRVRKIDDIQLHRQVHENDVKCDQRVQRFYSAIEDLSGLSGGEYT
ncbi:MAG: AAA family ATPase [Fibrobacteria bacterium]|nr:AAA family ATPase [Fibrobacteria bacterium]